MERLSFALEVWRGDSFKPSTLFLRLNVTPHEASSDLPKP